MRNKPSHGVSARKSNVTARKSTLKTSRSFNNLNEQRRLFNHILDKLNIETLDGMYKLKTNDIVTNGGGSCLKYYYRNSLWRAFSFVFPEIEWQPWRFVSSPHNYWQSEENQKKYLDWLSKEIGINKPEDWYSVSLKEIKNHHGSGLLELYNFSLSTMLQTLYPVVDWKPWLFTSFDMEYWMEPKNQRKYFDWIADTLHIEQQEQWLSSSYSKLVVGHANSLIQKIYKGSLKSAIENVYPEYNWNVSVSPGVTESSWTSTDRHRKFFDSLAAKLNITKDEWYKVKKGDIISRGGSDILKFYGNSLYTALSTLYPECRFQVWNIEKLGPEFWSVISNQKKFLDWFADEHNMDSFKGWYSVKLEQIKESGGRGLLVHFGGCDNSYSLSTAVQQVYPEYDWLPWLFHKVPLGYWSEEQNVLKYLLWLAKETNVNSLSDWYNISVQRVRQLGGSSVVRMGGLRVLLQKYFPHNNWNMRRFDSPTKSQFRLLEVAKKMFPSTQILTNFKHPQLLYSDTKQMMELDIFIPSMSLAFEHQGQHHYPSEYFQGLSTEIYSARDKEKREACVREGITLIEVPYWWDLQEDSLIATIHQVRPDLIQCSNGTPIPAVPPPIKSTGKYTKLYGLKKGPV